MALSGKGMLVIMTDIPSSDEADFNRWYDREHTQERVAIPGFVRARRWVLADGRGEGKGSAPKYLALYETETFEVLSSGPYKAALAAQTQWSKDVMGRFLNVGRFVARITRAEGLGSGGAIAVIRLRPDRGAEDALRSAVEAGLRAIVGEAGVVSGFLLESDPELSKPLPEHKVAPGEDSSRDWLLCIEGTSAEAALDAIAGRLPDSSLTALGAQVLATAAYGLMWGLTRAEMEREGALGS
jgi:hypothetical protein